MVNKINFYTRLGVHRTASQEEIRRAYFKAAQLLHPDKNTRPGETEIFLDVKEAYDILSDPLKRAKYDQTLPPQEVPHAPVIYQAVYSRKSLTYQSGPQLVYALIDFDPPIEAESEDAPPLNVSLVIDRSTSMKGEKMEVVKVTAGQILKSLRPTDIFSLVVFSDHAEVILPASQSVDQNRAEARLQTIQQFGGTEIFKGLDAALDEVQRFYNKSFTNHIVLLTDGKTYGDEQACLELSDKAAKLGIGISGLGIGKDWNDRFLDTLAHRTGGACIYVSRPKDIKRLLAAKFEQLSNTYANDLVLEFEKLPDVDINYIFRLSPEASPLIRDNPIHLGPIPREGSLTVIMELKVHQTIRSMDFIDLIDGTLSISRSDDEQPLQKVPFQLSRSVTEEPSTEPPPEQIIQALSKLTLYRLQERAIADAEAGEYAKAARRLKHVATNLLIQGQDALARTVLFEVENLERNNSLTEDGEKEIKFGTRALMLAPGKGQ